MSFQLRLTPDFARSIKRLAKKYRSLPDDVNELTKQLADNPTFGTPLGHNCYKIRLAIASKGKGKSRGARVITYVRVTAKRSFC